MEKYAMVKTEVQRNGDILLFYVDENGQPIEDAEGMITAIDQDQLEQLQENYILEEVPENPEFVAVPEPPEIETKTILEQTPIYQEKTVPDTEYSKGWLEEETEKLLMFYIDNKDAFQSYTTPRKHLWSVACKTMLIGKNPANCDAKLRNLKRKYALLYADHVKNKNEPPMWILYQLCHKAFKDDQSVKSLLEDSGLPKVYDVTTVESEPNINTAANKKKASKVADEKVMHMLEIYLQYKNTPQQKDVWNKIAERLGDFAEYWYKRFLNYKQHYIRILSNPNSQQVGWPYLSIFDKIYAGNESFKQKYGPPAQSAKIIPSHNPASVATIQTPVQINEWNTAEMILLVKYYFDCIEEYADPTIPNAFLWNEIGRLLDKKPEDCNKKYLELKQEHVNFYIEGGYNLRTRKPLAILFDNIISKETARKLCDQTLFGATELNWSMEKIDELVQFFFDNIEMFKDPICYFVCWHTVTVALNESLEACKDHWNDLTNLYKLILHDKQEDSDLVIDWRYIDTFDRIFDYGMDSNLLDGYENQVEQTSPTKVKPKQDSKSTTKEDLEDLSDEDFDEKSSEKRSRGVGDPKQIKILEYYLKNKYKFVACGQQKKKKHELWSVLSKQIGISAEQCAHRFRNLKQVYLAYVQREIEKPEKPILWPYYALCKKVFSYRAIKNKLKNDRSEVEEEEWSPKEIRSVINYFGRHSKEISDDTDDLALWSSLAKELNKSETSVRDKFLELRKSYRKIKTMVNKNPDCKINWKYFKLFEQVYNNEEEMEVDQQEFVSLQLPPNAIKTELPDDDEFQCIIVIPEGENIENLSNAEILQNLQTSQNQQQEKPSKNPWSKEEKSQLLDSYYEYIKANDGKTIDTKKMWTEIATGLPNRTPFNCKRVFLLLKNKYKAIIEEQPNKSFNKSNYLSRIKKILALKPKFHTPPLSADELEFNDEETFTDVEMPLWKVEKGLKYYLEHLEEFTNPKYDKKYAWLALAKSVSCNVKKIYKKINYLKQFYNSETNEVNGEKVTYGENLKEILEKEFICKIALGDHLTPQNEDDSEVTWSDEEVEELLKYYLENLSLFKNPKYASSYLWNEASDILQKSAIACSNKMNEIRSQYSTMAKESPDSLCSWRFYDLCQKIYGTGKRNIEMMEQ